MNDRIKALLLTALRLSPEEREELAQTLLANLSADLSAVAHLYTDADDERDTEPPQPASDVMARYLDI